MALVSDLRSQTCCLLLVLRQGLFLLLGSPLGGLPGSCSLSGEHLLAAAAFLPGLCQGRFQMLNALLEVLYSALSCPELALQCLSFPGSCLSGLLCFLGSSTAQLPVLLQLLLRCGGLLLCLS